MLEAGARFEDGDFPNTSFDAKRCLFAPAAGMYGIQRIDMVKDCLILAGAGVGGGSLVYANTLYEPLDAFYRDPSWARITDWKSELAPYYDQAKRMLGVVENPLHTPSDEVMQQVAEDMGVGHTFRHDPGRRLLRRPGRDARRGGGRPVLRWRRTGPQRLPQLRRVHDRLPTQRQEHPREELPPPRRAGRRRRPPADDGDARTPARRWWLRGDGALDQGQAVASYGRRDVHRRPGDLLRGGAGHPEAAAPAQGGGRPAPRQRPAGRADPHQLGGDPRRRRGGPVRRLHARAWPSPPPSTPTR